MPGHSYDRYGLVSNPFRDLSSENLEDVSIYHVNQDVDDNLRTIREEVFDKENKALVAITGELGAGKTERLLMTASEARARGAFTIYLDVTAKTTGVVRAIASEIQKGAQKAKKVGFLSAPPWYRKILPLTKLKDEKYDGKTAGRAIGEALNGTAPSTLLLNDLHNLVQSREADAFARMMLEVTDVIKPGVLVMFSSYTSYLAWLSVNHPALASRINRTFVLTSFSDDEAALLLAKKLLVKRLVEDLDPIFPFDREAVHELVVAAQGNPRRLLELADLSIEYGIARRAYRVDAELVKTVLSQPRVVDIATKLLGRPAPTSPPTPARPATAPPAARPPAPQTQPAAKPAAPPPASPQAQPPPKPAAKPVTRPPG
jgi:type II secretory pathway predicted ATPase ExeA